MAHSDLPRRDPAHRATTLVGSIDEGLYAVSAAYRQSLVEAMTEDLAASDNEAMATAVLVDELDVRVDTLETTTEALTVQASGTGVRVDDLAAQTDALTRDRVVTHDRQTALLVDIAQRRATIDARLETAADHQSTLLADIAQRRADIDARLEAGVAHHVALLADITRRREAIDARFERIERLAAAMGLTEDATSLDHAIEPPLPSTH